MEGLVELSGIEPPRAAEGQRRLAVDVRMSKAKIPPDLQIWIEARRRFRLSHAQIQIARELGMPRDGA